MADKLWLTDAEVDKRFGSTRQWVWTPAICNLAVIRSISLNQTESDPRELNGTAKVEVKARTTLKDVGVAVLIAQPMN